MLLKLKREVLHTGLSRLLLGEYYKMDALAADVFSCILRPFIWVRAYASMATGLTFINAMQEI